MYTLIRCLGFLPRSWLQCLGRALGLVLFYLPSRSKRVSDLNIRRCFPDLRSGDRNQLVRQSLKSTGQTALETPGVWSKKSEHLLTWIDHVYGDDLLQDALSSADGTLLLIPHIGNWELFNAIFAQTGFQMTALFKPPKQPELAAIIKKVRMRYGNDMVPTNPRGLAQLFRVLNAGGTVAVLPDQVPQSGVYIPFFEHSAYTDRLAHRLTLKTKATPLLVALIRNASGRFDVHYRKVTRLTASDETSALQGLNEAIEQLVREFPEQYQWEYKRFKNQPDTTIDLYSDC